MSNSSEPQRYSMHVEYWRNEYIVEAREIDRGDWIKHEDFIAYKEQHERECLQLTDEDLFELDRYSDGISARLIESICEKLKVLRERRKQ